MAAVDHVAEDAAARRADDQPGRAVAALAIIAAVGAAIDAIVVGKNPLAVFRAIPIVTRRIIAILIPVVLFARGGALARSALPGLLIVIEFGAKNRQFVVQPLLRGLETGCFSTALGGGGRGHGKAGQGRNGGDTGKSDHFGLPRDGACGNQKHE
jgi:hypothetical protein